MQALNWGKMLCKANCPEITCAAPVHFGWIYYISSAVHCITLRCNEVCCTIFWWTTLHLLRIRLHRHLNFTHSIHFPPSNFLFQPEIILIAIFWFLSNVLAPKIHLPHSPILASLRHLHLFSPFFTTLHSLRESYLMNEWCCELRGGQPIKAFNNLHLNLKANVQWVIESWWWWWWSTYLGPIHLPQRVLSNGAMNDIMNWEVVETF